MSLDKYISPSPDPYGPWLTGMMRQYPTPPSSKVKRPPRKFYGFATNNPFTLKQSLQCKIGGLVTGRHNEVRNSLSIMEAQYLSKSQEQKIYSPSMPH